MSADVALGLADVSAGYGETVVLENLTLSLHEGESLSIIGPNGVGKTTLLATVMGHTTLHGGRIRLPYRLRRREQDAASRSRQAGAADRSRATIETTEWIMSLNDTRACGQDLGPATGNWKAQAVTRTVPAHEHGRYVVLHADLELREHACPGCGTLLESEVCRKDEDSFGSAQALPAQ